MESQLSYSGQSSDESLVPTQPPGLEHEEQLSESPEAPADFERTSENVVIAVYSKHETSVPLVTTA